MVMFSEYFCVSGDGGTSLCVAVKGKCVPDILSFCCYEAEIVTFDNNMTICLKWGPKVVKRTDKQTNEIFV